MSTVNQNPSPRTTGFATASLILALASLLVGPFSAVPAIFCGHKALSRMRKNPAIDGFGRALAGTILGYSFMIVFACLALMVFFWSLARVDPPG
jgi:hypothetical protein